MSYWRQIQKTNLRSAKQVQDFFGLTDLEKRKFLLETPFFSYNLPLRIAKKITNIYNDPLAKQFLPHKDEEVKKEGFSLDPVMDKKAMCTPKLLQKYAKRVLLITTGGCAMHCRFCFRKNYPYELPHEDFEEELALISKDFSIKEIILSGGDPLSLSDKHLFSLLKKIDQMDHISRVRLHSRFLIGIPERIDLSFINNLQQLSKKIYFALHINHPRELDSAVIHAMHQLQKANVSLLSQTVLLKDVNNCANTLEELFDALCDIGCLPYYLHQLDKVEGASHFEVPVEEGKNIIEELRKRLSGYALPRYVYEEPLKPYKSPL